MNATEQDLDALAGLEERITRAIDLVASLRQEKADLETQLSSAVAERDSLSQELAELRSERKQVRSRIEKLIGQMDLLSNA
jgi:FtsZ-binding cell division protein ZapB